MVGVDVGGTEEKHWMEPDNCHDRLVEESAPRQIDARDA